MYNDEIDFAEILQNGLRSLITDEWGDDDPVCWENFKVRTFEEEGVLTTDKGLVITCPDGSEYQLSIVQSR